MAKLKYIPIPGENESRLATTTRIKWNVTTSLFKAQQKFAASTSRAASAFQSLADSLIFTNPYLYYAKQFCLAVNVIQTVDRSLSTFSTTYTVSSHFAPDYRCTLADSAFTAAPNPVELIQRSLRPLIHRAYDPIIDLLDDYLWFPSRLA